MSYQLSLGDIGIFPMSASGATNVNRYRFVRLVGGEIKSASDAVAAFGVCQIDSPVAGQAVKVQVAGIASVEASAAIAADAGVELGADGRVETLGAGVRVGTAITASTAAGDIISVLIA